jgi:hypothetical protein
MKVIDMIKEKKFLRIGKKTTICLIILDNGYEVIGASSCINPSDYDYETGKLYAEDDAMNKLVPIASFLANERLYMLNTGQLEKQEEDSYDEIMQ